MSFDTVFLDRDGTLNVKAPKGDYITRTDDVALLPGAAAAVRELNRAAVRTVLVTNQRCLALGLVDEVQYDAITARLRLLLSQQGAQLDAEYTCPHARDACECRKPLPGLLLRAAHEHPEIDLARAALVGDSESDVIAGRAIGLTTVRIDTSGDVTQADYVAADLLHAVQWLLSDA